MKYKKGLVTDFPLKIIVVLVFVGVIAGIYIMATGVMESSMEDEGPAIARLRGTGLSTRIISSPDCLSTGTMGVLNSTLIENKAGPGGGLGEDCINMTGFKAVAKVGWSPTEKQGYCPPGTITFDRGDKTIEKTWNCTDYDIDLEDRCHLGAIDPHENFNGVECPKGSQKSCPDRDVRGRESFCSGGDCRIKWMDPLIESYYENVGEECGDMIRTLEWKTIGEDYLETSNLVGNNIIKEGKEANAYKTSEEVDLPDSMSMDGKIASWLVYGFSETYAVNVNGGPGRIYIDILMVKPWTTIEQTGGFGSNRG